MGWSVKGYRPNKPRRVTVFMKDGQKVRVRRPSRKDGYRLGGKLTRTAIGVRRIYIDGNVTRYERHTWSQDYVLHPTKGYRVASKVRKTSETTKNSRLPKDWHLGVSQRDTFTRNGGIIQ